GTQRRALPQGRLDPHGSGDHRLPARARRGRRAAVRGVPPRRPRRPGAFHRSHPGPGRDRAAGRCLMTRPTSRAPRAPRAPRAAAWLALLLCAASAWAATPAGSGSAAPPALEQYRGRPVLVNWWATWCGPCIREMPELDEFARSQSGAGAVQVVGIALDEAANVDAYLARRPVRYPVLVEAVEYGESGSSAGYGNRHGVLPYSVLLDARGRVVRSKAGPLTAAELASWQAALPR